MFLDTSFDCVQRSILYEAIAPLNQQHAKWTIELECSTNNLSHVNAISTVALQQLSYNKIQIANQQLSREDFVR